MQYHVKPSNTGQYHAIPCNTMQYYSIQSNTMKLKPIPCIIINCWRSVPLPCGQYMAIFTSQIVMFLTADLSVGHGFDEIIFWVVDPKNKWSPFRIPWNSLFCLRNISSFENFQLCGNKLPRALFSNLQSQLVNFPFFLDAISSVSSFWRKKVVMGICKNRQLQFILTCNLFIKTTFVLTFCWYLTFSQLFLRIRNFGFQQFNSLTPNFNLCNSVLAFQILSDISPFQGN